MDPTLGSHQPPAGATGPGSHDLAEDGERGLLGRERPDVQADGTRHARELLLAEPALEEPLAPLLLRAAAAEGPDVAHPAPDGPADRRVVELRVVGQDDDRVLG